MRVPTLPETSEPEPAPERRDQAEPGTRDRRWWLAGVLLVIVGLPLVVAAVTLRGPRWFPVLDLAMTELRLRDVGTSHTPLIGLPGRIGPSLAEQGSHPGPLSFYLLAPLYRALGSSAWAMQSAAIVLNLLALGAALAIAARRGGTRLVLAVGALLTLLSAGYGLTVLTQPWNPYLPLLWWLVFLLAAWSVACGDVAMLPVAVAAGSLCAQTHVPYLGLAVGLGVVVAALAGWAWWRAAPASPARRSVVCWGVAAGVLGVALWVPPLVDQATNDPGNIRAIYDHLGTPDEDPVGLGGGAELALAHLDIPRLLTSDPGDDGTLLDASADADGVAVGLAVLGVWVLAAVAAWRHGPRALVRLHLVVAAAVVLGVVALARIVGKEWYYLMLWAWAVTALMLLAIGWSALVVLGRRLGPAGLRRTTTAVAAVLGVAIVAGAAASAVQAVELDPPEPHLSATLGAVVPDTIAALERGEGAATGRDGRYTVVFNDAAHIGSQAYGLASELRRAGFHAGMLGVYHVPITDHRVIERDDATAAVAVTTGRYVDEWRLVRGAVEVAYVEPDPAAQAEFAELRTAVIDDLAADGLDELAPLVDDNLFRLSIDERISEQAEGWTARMLELGVPTAVFITPPDATL